NSASNRGRSALTQLALPAVLAVLASVFLLLVTPKGLNLTPDSYAYMGVASSISDGRGVTMPFVPIATEVRPLDAAAYHGAAPLYQYSPGLPMLLSGPVAVGLSPRSAAKGLNVLCIGAIAAMVAWTVLRLS